MAGMHWAEQLRLKEKIHERYPTVWNLKIVRKRLPVILDHLRDGESVLEIGAFDRGLEERIKRRYPRVLYRSLDTDPTYPHDYSSFEEVKEPFDMVLLFEVIEHLSLEEGRDMIRNIHRALVPGGRVIMTTPNVYTPGQYWKDVSHRVPYHYKELGALLLAQPFELLGMFRLYNAPGVTFATKVFLFSPFFRLLGIDFTRSILFVARKPREAVKKSQS